MIRPMRYLGLDRVHTSGAIRRSDGAKFSTLLRVRSSMMRRLSLPVLPLVWTYKRPRRRPPMNIR